MFILMEINMILVVKKYSNGVLGNETAAVKPGGAASDVMRVMRNKKF